MPFNSDAELLLFLEDNISLLTFSSILFVLLKKFSLYSFPLFFSSRILSYEGKYLYVHTAPIFEWLRYFRIVWDCFYLGTHCMGLEPFALAKVRDDLSKLQKMIAILCTELNLFTTFS